MVEPELFRGLADVDSVSMDAHKWLYQPLDCSVLLYRDPAAARRAFSLTDDYAASLSDDPVEGDVFFEETIELSRRVRALKLWLSLRYHGLACLPSRHRRQPAAGPAAGGPDRPEPSLERMADVPAERGLLPVGRQATRRRSTGRTPRSWTGSTGTAGCTCRTPPCAAASCCAPASPTTAPPTPTSRRSSRRCWPQPDLGGRSSADELHHE